MKTNNRFQAIFLTTLFTLSSLLFNACSSDDNINSAPINFEPVTIDLTQVDFDVDDTSFTVQGFNFNNFMGEPCANLNCFPGIALFLGSNQDDLSFIELDLTSTTGISRITSRLLNNCLQSTRITIFNGDEVINDFSAFVPTTTEEGGFNDNLYETNGQTITAVRISSCEAIVQSITLE